MARVPRRLLGAVLAALTVASLAAAPARADTQAVYDRQLDGSTQLFLINAPNNAAAQAFTTADARLTALSAYLVSNSDTGTLDAQIRTSVTDPSTTLAESTLQLSALGGAGSGWVTFPVDTAVTPGKQYFLVLQASDTTDKVIWNGVRASLPDALSSWNYDLPYWGGWQEYNTDSYTSFHAAFAIDPTGEDACAASNSCYQHIPAADLGVTTAGLLGNGQTTVAIPPGQAYGSSYIPDSDVLVLPDGRWRYLPAGATAPVTVTANDARARARIAADRAWLHSGRVPGKTAQQRDMASRALLDLHLLEQPNGALAAAWYGAWKYNWPRDASFAAVALAATGHGADAYRILTFTASTQKADGTWDARTLLTGPQVPDGRQFQLDADGWFPWAVWEWAQAATGDQRNRLLPALFPAVQRAADLAAGSLNAQGLPPASPDYWEVATTAPNIGTAAPWLSGLHSAAALARQQHDRADAARWEAAAQRLQAGIDATFATNGYSRTVNGDGRDSAVTFMTGPYNHGSTAVDSAIDSTFGALLTANGGVVPGNDPAHTWSTSWTPETMFFALAWSGTHHSADRSEQLVSWLAGKRTALGTLPEQVNQSGIAISVAPLGWTDALTLMTLTQLDGRNLPIPR
jgi:hypothetical protein